MNLLRLIIIAAIIGIIWFFIKRWQAEQEAKKVLEKPPKKPEIMQQCAYCGAHFPISEAVYEKERPYCCEAHRIAARQQQNE